LGGEAAVAGPTTACQSYGKLNSAMPDVLYDNPHFSVGTQSFPIEVFSLANPAPWSPNFICLRYELENVGNSPIPLLFWDLIHEWSATDLPPYERLLRVRRRPSASREPVKGVTAIKAFRSEEVTTTVWQTIEDWQKNSKKANKSDFHPYLRFERSAKLDQAAANAITQQQILDAEVAVVDPTADAIELPPPVNDPLRGQFGEISSVSGVYIAGQRPAVPIYGVSGNISVQAKPGVSFEVYAPAFSAIQSLGPTGTTSGFLQALKNASLPITQIPEKGSFRVSMTADFLDRVFIVEHPISIVWRGPEGTGSACLRAAYYSLFPVSIGENYCAK
jgi:hypothetical protein